MRQNILSRLRKDQGGFTLIELVVVVVIIGLLAAVTVPKFIGQRENAVQARIDADVKILQNAVDLYYAEEGGYPADLDALATAGYVKAIPLDPFVETPDNMVYAMNADNEVEYAVVATP